MASETALFKKRIAILVQISNTLGDSNLSSSLQNLFECVCATGSLNSGGKFEWIDSILVKVRTFFKNFFFKFIFYVNIIMFVVFK